MRAADIFGIERDYWDIWGNHHFAPPEDIAAVLGSMGIDGGSQQELDRAVESRLWEIWSRPVPSTVVTSVNDPYITMHVSRDSAAADVEVRWEDGSTDRAVVDLTAGEESGASHLREREFVAKRVRVPFEPRLGYHELRVTLPETEPATTRWILCPDRAYFPPRLANNGRAGGLFVSLFGLRSNRNWGCGDFTDLKGLIEWVAADLGASFIGLNPLHAIPNRQPYNTSPYLPLCIFYKNLIYLDVEAIEDFQKSEWARSIVQGPRVQSLVAQLRAAEYVEYGDVQRLKLRVLKALFRSFLQHEYRKDTARARDFQRYVESEGALLHDFAVYCALEHAAHRRDKNVWLWRDWPVEYQDPESEDTRAFAREHWRTVLFNKYVQWQLELQLAAAQRHATELGLPIGLYHDLALATDRFGADLWAHRRFYVAGCRVGAPPDDFSPNGQDWSFPPPDSYAHYQDGYRLFTESIRKNVRHGGALRIDHVMRFFHLFWIPDRLSAKRGIYVRDRHEDLIRILALESVRNQVIIVGEDLGTVADEVRETLSRFGILSYRLFYFEKRKDGSFKHPNEYSKQSLVSASTHDLPTLAGFWENRDIEARRVAKMFHDDSGYHAQIADRMREKQKILDLLLTTGLLPADHPRVASAIPELTGQLHYAIVSFLASTPSSLMLLSEEDLMKQKDQQNLPGTTEEYPNWRHKTRFTVEELRESRAALDFSLMYKTCLEKTGRASASYREHG